MRKFLPYFIVFVLGFFVCAWTIFHFYGAPTGFPGIASVNAPRGGIKIAGRGSNEVREAAKLVSQYVVNIDTVGRPVHQPGFGGFSDFFGLPSGEPQEVIPKGLASGVVFNSSGYIVTNNHVVENAAKLIVTLSDGKSYTARLIGRDPRTDLAVIKIDAGGLKYATFGNSDTLEVGDWVVAVGSALGFKSTVTLGVVSAKRASGELDGRMTAGGMIQTDAAINRGNSGGALADLNGNLVGINTAIFTTAPGQGNVGIGFAIPSNTAKKIAEELVKKGRIIRPWLGIAYFGYTSEVRSEMERHGATGLPKPGGAIIWKVYSGSPAENTGLQPMDVILKMNGRPVASERKPGRGEVSIADQIAKVKVGSSVLLEVRHASNGRIDTVAIWAAAMPPDFGQEP